MPNQFNIYCDESCHLEGDRQPHMVLGAVWCPTEEARAIAVRLREIKRRHNLPARFESKWSKVSPAKVGYFVDAVDYFFDDDDLHFRALVAEKGRLNHNHFHQSHDDWYFKMYFNLLKCIIKPGSQYRVFLDIKDTQSATKVRHLHSVLGSNFYDFDQRLIQIVQTVQSHEVEQVQLTDLLIGAVGYANRGMKTSSAKLAIIERIRQRSKYKLTVSTLPREEKTNIFIWKPQSVGD